MTTDLRERLAELSWKRWQEEFPSLVDDDWKKKVKDGYFKLSVAEMAVLQNVITQQCNQARLGGEIAEHHRTCDGGKMCPRCAELGTVYRGDGGGG